MMCLYMLWLHLCVICVFYANRPIFIRGVDEVVQCGEVLDRRGELSVFLLEVRVYDH